MSRELYLAGAMFIVVGVSAMVFVIVVARQNVRLARSQDVLRQSEERFRSLFEESSVGTCVAAPDGRYLHVNPAYCRMLGYDRGDFQGKFIWDTGPPDDRERFLEGVARACASGLDSYQIEKPFRHKDGHIVWGHVSATIVRDANGEILHLLSQTQDVTERKHAEQAVRDSEASLRLVTDALPVLIAYIDKDLRYRFANKQYKDWWGRDPEDVVGRHVSEIIGPEQFRRYGPVVQEALSGKRLTVEGPALYPDGTKRDIEGHFVPDVDASGNVKGVYGMVIDLTERKRAEEGLRSMKTLLEHTIAGLDDALFVLGPYDRTIVMANAAAERMFRMPISDMIGQSTTILHKDDASYKALGEMVHKALNDGGAFRGEWEMRRSDGSVFPSEHAVSPILDEAGWRIGIVSMVRDITDRRHAEQALRASEARFRSIFENSAIGAAVTTPDGKFLQVNDAICRMFCYSATELYAMNLKDVTHPDDMNISFDALRELEFGNADTLAIEKRYVRKNETVFSALTNISAVRDADGRYAGSIGQVIDITAEKSAEKALRDSEERFRQIAEVAPTSILITRPENGQILYVNPAAAEVMDAPADQLLGRSTLEFFTDPQEREDLIAEMTSTGQVRNRELSVFSDKGRPTTIMLSMRPIEHAGERAVLTTFVDVTELRDARAQLIKSAKLATLGEMATGIAHELNQPLNVIRISSDILADEAETPSPSSETVARHAQRISSQTDRASAIVDHLRAFGRKTPLEKERVDVARAVEAAADMLREQIRLMGVAFHVEVPDRCGEVMGHGIQLEQTVLNLLANARDAIETRINGNRNSHDHRIDITVNEDAAKGRISIVVHDTGGGIPESTLARVFEPFYTTKDLGKGTGLSLSVSHGIVRDMGGTIEAANAGRGARITITLPKAPPQS